HTLTFSISVAAEIGRNFAGAIEIRVQTSICFETGECTLSSVFVCGVTRDNNSSITEHGHTAREVVGTAVGSCLPGLVEARIESSICIVADDREIIVAPVDERVACH